MPSLYVDSSLIRIIHDKRDELKRAAQNDDNGEEPYVPEKDALEELLSTDAKRKLERIRQ